ncbi:hypothetical protein [Streptomyces endophyticus]|uniref:Uncharacterized protein n=1 Tax=Streptomyces endophyticus TaxID=714166 RepID=A0ABU6F8A3_9ACTN|nr:hypothetical protein [Streptomyces endophyticus]MEB8340188.1 hypothetical protein [Streptomyces endophyticus]
MGQRLVRLGDACCSGAVGEAGRGDDVEGVVVQAAVGDQEVLRLRDGRTDHAAMQMAGVLREIPLHPVRQVRVAEEMIVHDE